MISFTRAFESGLITMWKRYDYLSSFFLAKFDYQQNDLIQDLNLEDESSAIIILSLFSFISFIALFFEIIINLI